MAHVMPDPDGSKSCSEQIAKLYFKANKEKIVELHGYNGILSRREELVELIEKMKNEKETIDQKIKLEMQDASKALAERYQIVWSSYNSSRLDSKRLKAEKPEIYEAYVNKSSERRFSVKRVA